ncbi:MAG: T9SS type A sorting domain-containing protein [Rhodothermales bacterium]|nr:T9SS type A sorting domain-containing protein [Rhodothermales bacterium]MBO6779933.1 T9SS type A sorting domain-containing protein [Rhodothermales bacterium]
MIGFYNVMGRVARPVALLALLSVALAPASTAQIAFPDFAHAKSVVFTTDGGNEVQVVGTHSFGIYRTIPGAVGTNKWNEASGLTKPITINDMVVLANGNVLAGASGSGGQQTDVNATGLFTSADGGSSWSAVAKSAFDSLAVHTVQAIAQSPADSVIFLSADDGNIFISQDHGASWTFNGRLPGGSSQLPWALLAHPTTAGTVYAGTPGYGVFVSTDHGAGWSVFTDNTTLLPADPAPGTGGGHVFDLEMNPANANQMYAATAGGVWRFDDVTSASGSWSRMAAADSSFTLVDGTTYNAYPEVRSIAFNNAGTTLYMATWGFGVLTTTDFTGSPSPTQIALRGEQVSTVAVAPSGAVFAGTANGVHEVVAASSTEVSPQNDVPEGYTLRQNYPNPFNPTTSITFDLPTQADVSLRVFDVLGREVAVLAQGTRAAGSHTVTFEAAGMPSGLYLYRLDAGDQSLTRTMSLVK